MKRIAVLVIIVALIAGMVGCPADPEPTPPVEYTLTISSGEGGEVTTPGEGQFTYGEGVIVNLVAGPSSGHYFGGWTGDVGTIANVRAASTTITVNGDYSITASFQVIPAARYSLTVSSTEGGSVIAPGEGTFTYDAGKMVDLVAEAEEGYQFTYWSGSVGTVDDVNAASTTVTMTGDYTITASFAKEIRTWHDLDAIRDNLSGHYVLVNDLDSATAGYAQLAGPTANQGKGWHPIGSLRADPSSRLVVHPVHPFTGSLEGQGHEIRDLFVSRPGEDGVGLFGCVGAGVIGNLGVVNAEVTGHDYVGGMVGANHHGTLSNSYFRGSITGKWCVGGLVGHNWDSTVGNSYSTGSVTGEWTVGGLVGANWGTASNSYSLASVTGQFNLGGLVGANWRTVNSCYSAGSLAGLGNVGGLLGWNSGTVNNSYSRGRVTGKWSVHGLIGRHHDGTVSNSYYSYDDVLINDRNIITIGSLFREDFEQWLANDRFLDIDQRLSKEYGYYVISSVSDLKQLLAFGQDGSLKFRLKDDLDLGGEPGFYVPYLAGEFDGNGHRIANLTFNSDLVSQVGLFGYLGSGGVLTGVRAENVDITGVGIVGGLVGENHGKVSNSYSTGRVAGYWCVGGLVGLNLWGTVSNSHYNYDESRINGKQVITIGALCAEDFDQWLASDMSLDVNERLHRENGYYTIGNLGDFRQLLAFGQDSSLKFRLDNDLDLSDNPDFYIPYLAGEFDGDAHTVSNLSLTFDFVASVGLFGGVASSGRVTRLGVENVSIRGHEFVGGLVGANRGTVSHCYSSGSVTGALDVGGLVGSNIGTVSNSYSSSSVTGDRWGVGGLIGRSMHGSVGNSYSTGSVTANGEVGGLVGLAGYAVMHSFWDIQTSGQRTSAGGTGKTTAELKSIATFSGAGWSIAAVTSGERKAQYIWNIVDGQTYPFLSWQPVL